MRAELTELRDMRGLALYALCEVGERALCAVLTSEKSGSPRVVSSVVGVDDWSLNGRAG
ncbi:MAG: hypothetical protein R2826_10135 [Thermoleophilia bacterium]